MPAPESDAIENPLTGERIVFLRTAEQTGGELLEMDDFWSRPGHRAAEHIHPQMQERWELIEGSASFQIGAVQRIAQPGDVIVAPAGVPHLAWNPGTEPVHLRIQMRPALRWQDFVRRLFALAQQSLDAGPANIPPAELAALLREFPQELALP